LRRRGRKGETAIEAERFRKDLLAEPDNKKPALQQVAVELSWLAWPRKRSQRVLAGGLWWLQGSRKKNRHFKRKKKKKKKKKKGLKIYRALKAE